VNLVLSGPIQPALRDRIAEVVGAATVVALHPEAERFDDVPDSADVRDRVAMWCDADRVDHAFVADGAVLADFRLMAMDMDSTLITIECIDELADLAGKGPEVAAITAAAMRGEIVDFAESLRRRVALLKGAPASLLQRVMDERLQLTPGATELIRAARAAGIHTLLLSGGFTFFAEKLRQQLNLDECAANILEIRDGKLTGELLGPILDGNAKARRVAESLARHGLTSKRALVIGDGANDIPMMRLAGTSIAYRAKPVTEATASHRIRYGTLRVALDYWPTDTPKA
jgi:phosphoserine phosphatase